MINKVYIFILNFLSALGIIKPYTKYLFLFKRGYLVGKYSYGYPKIVSWNKNSKLSIGNYCSISANVVLILDGIHDMNKLSTYPTSLISNYTDTIPNGELKIGHDVWIGYGVKIIGNINIGTGSVISAYSVVYYDVPEYAIIRGNPAKIIGFRFNQDIIEKINRSQWWLNDPSIDIISKMRKNPNEI